MCVYICLFRNKYIMGEIIKKNKEIINIKFQIVFGGGEIMGREYGCGRLYWNFKCIGNVLEFKA